MKSKKPFSVTILIISVLIFTAWNGLRLYEIILYWEVFVQYNSHPGAYYLASFSLIWLISSLIILIGFLKRKSKHVIFLAKLISILYVAWYWIDRIVFQNTLINILFPLIITVIMLLFILILLNLKHTQIYFKLRENHD